MGQQSEINLLPEYRILREKSFEGTQEGTNLGEHFLSAQKTVSSSTSRVVVPCLARIIQKRRIPTAQRNLLINESTKIMRYFSTTEALNGGRVHRLLEAFLIKEATDAEKLIFFYETLTRHCSLLAIVKAVAERPLSSQESKRFPPPLTGSSMFTLTHVHAWVRDVAQTAVHLAAHGLAHRYIRPEYLYVNEENWMLVCSQT